MIADDAYCRQSVLCFKLNRKIIKSKKLRKRDFDTYDVVLHQLNAVFDVFQQTVAGISRPFYVYDVACLSDDYEQRKNNRARKRKRQRE